MVPIIAEITGNHRFLFIVRPVARRTDPDFLLSIVMNLRRREEHAEDDARAKNIDVLRVVLRSPRLQRYCSIVCCWISSSSSSLVSGWWVSKARSLLVRSGSQVYSATFARPTADHRSNWCSPRSHTDSCSQHSRRHRADEEFASLCWTSDDVNWPVSSSSSSSSGSTEERVENSMKERVKSTGWDYSLALNEERRTK